MGFDDDYDDDVEYCEVIEECRQKSKKKNGLRKYYNKPINLWDFTQALIDNFKELEEDYEADSSTLREIILETYEIDHDRTVKYLKWLWKTFPPNLFVNERNNSNRGRNSYDCRGALIDELIEENGNSKELYELLNRTKIFLLRRLKIACMKNIDIRLLSAIRCLC